MKQLQQLLIQYENIERGITETLKRYSQVDGYLQDIIHTTGISRQQIYNIINDGNISVKIMRRFLLMEKSHLSSIFNIVVPKLANEVNKPVNIIAKVSEHKFAKWQNITDLSSFKQWLFKEFPEWKYINIYDSESRKQINNIKRSDVY